MRFGKLFTMGLAAVTAAVPAAARKKKLRPEFPREQGGGGERCKPNTSILELVFCASGEEGDFDTRKQDYDILRELVIAAGLVDAVNGLEDATVFIPNDKAFERLAEALGYDADEYDEEAILTFLGEALSDLGELSEVLPTVLYYHIADEMYTFDSLKNGKTVTTLQGGTIDARSNRKGHRVILKDKEPDLPDPRIHDLRNNFNTNQGYVHIITRVLVPLDI